MPRLRRRGALSLVPWTVSISVALVVALPDWWGRSGGGFYAAALSITPEGTSSGVRLEDGFLALFGGMLTFLALALVCDEHMCPAIEALCERFEIPDDIAGTCVARAPLALLLYRPSHSTAARTPHSVMRARARP